MTNRQKATLLIISALVVIIGASAAYLRHVVYKAIRDVDQEISGSVSAQELARDSVASNAGNLSRMSAIDAMLYLPSKQLGDIVTAAFQTGSQRLLSKNSTLEVSTSDLKLKLADQSLGFSVDLQIKDKSRQIEAIARVEGQVTVRFEGRDLRVRPAARRITLLDVKAQKLPWFPGQAVNFINPLIASVVDMLNGEVQEMPVGVLPKGSVVQTLKVGSSNIKVPAIEPRPPSFLLDESGLYVAVQLFGVPTTSKPAGDFASFRAEFFQKSSARFKKAPAFPFGFSFADAVSTDLLGSLRQSVEIEDVAAEAVRANAVRFNELRGVDVALRMSPTQAEELLGAVLVDAAKKLSKDDLTIKQPKFFLKDGVLGVTAGLTTRTRYGGGQIATGEWEIVLVAVPSAEPDPTGIALTPRIGRFTLQSLAISGGAPDLSFLLPALSSMLVTLKEEVNRLLPRIPISIPIVSPGRIDVKPINLGFGAELVFTPNSIEPVGVQVVRPIIAASESGVWIIAEIDGYWVKQDGSNPVAALPERTILNSRALDPQNTTAVQLDENIAKLVAALLGEPPNSSLFGMASWKRFAALFNAQWMRSPPKAHTLFDSGWAPMEPTRINLMDYARFECRRTRECKQARCEQRSCQIGSCGRDECGSCGDVEIKGPFGSVLYRGKDQACEARKATCIIAAEVRRGACNVDANLAKARCDADAVAEKTGCDVRSNLELFDCNRLAEQEVLFCEAKRLVTNGLAEVSGVGAIGGEARASGKLAFDFTHLKLREDLPEVAFSPLIDGQVKGELGIDWTPYDVLGHVFVCPLRGKVYADTTISFQQSRPATVATLASMSTPALPDAATPPDASASVPAASPLKIQIAKTGVPVTMEPGLLTSLYSRNPQIVVTCPIASALLGIPGLIIGNANRAISERDLAKVVATAQIAPGSLQAAALLNVLADENAKVGLGALFGGKVVNIPVPESTQEIPLKSQEVAFPGGNLVLTPYLQGNAFKFSVVRLKPKEAKVTAAAQLTPAPGTGR